MLDADQPVKSSDLDQFDRLAFASRISERILNSEPMDSITIGLYGKWGIGKSSILHFVRERLESEPDKVIVVEFNPWNFQGADSLTLGLLSAIKEALTKEVASDQEKYKRLFRSWGKKTKSFIKKKGAVTQAFSAFGVRIDASKFALLFDDDDVVLQKSQVNQLIRETKKRMVIITDDIDRLDKTELKQLFKLVRLSADFENTTYLLAFDKEVVSSAISGDYGGNENSLVGEDYLDKIIQLPLEVPVIQGYRLNQFAIKNLEKALNDMSIRMLDKEVEELKNVIISLILPLLTTPREVVRIINTLNFSLPLMRGEINLLDQCLIETIKVVNQKLYYWIAEKKNILTGLAPVNQAGTVTLEFKEELSKHLEYLELEDKSKYVSILRFLFPVVSKLDSQNNLLENLPATRELGVADPDYFIRYFSYGFSEGQLRESELSSFLKQIEGLNLLDLKAKLAVLLDGKSVQELVSRLSRRNIATSDLKTLIIALSSLDNSEAAEHHGPIQLGTSTVARYLFNTLVKINEEDSGEAISIASGLMKYAEPFSFAYSINNTLRGALPNGSKIFKDAQFNDLACILLNRAKDQIGNKAIYEVFDGNELQFLIRNWYLNDKIGLQNHISNGFQKDPDKVGKLLFAFAPTAYGGRSDTPFKADFSIESYKALSEYISNKILKRAIKDSNYQTHEVKPQWDFWEQGQSEANVVLQYLHWLNDNESSSPSVL